jgi:hypothetical protein
MVNDLMVPEPVPVRRTAARDSFRPLKRALLRRLPWLLLALLLLVPLLLASKCDVTLERSNGWRAGRRCCWDGHGWPAAATACGCQPAIQVVPSQYV